MRVSVGDFLDRRGTSNKSAVVACRLRLKCCRISVVCDEVRPGDVVLGIHPGAVAVAHLDGEDDRRPADLRIDQQHLLGAKELPTDGVQMAVSRLEAIDVQPTQLIRCYRQVQRPRATVIDSLSADVEVRLDGENVDSADEQLVADDDNTCLFLAFLQRHIRDVDERRCGRVRPAEI